jgi:type VI secretion system secreted protein VgrG
MPPIQADDAFAFFEVKGLKADTFKVVAFTGTEAVSTQFTYDLDVISTDKDLKFDSVLGKAAFLRVHGGNGDRYVHGIVRRIEETSRSAEFSRFAIVLVPGVWKLSLRQTSRIFQHQTVPAVVNEVLTKAGISEDNVKITVHGSQVPWEYCVQYRESDLDFVSRLLEQEGIFYFFEHTKEKAIFRTGNATSDHPPCPNVAKLPFRPESGMTGTLEDTITRFTVSEEVRPDATAVRDYNFKKASADLTAIAKEAPGLNTEVYDSPGEYDTPDEGKQVAKLRLQELRATRRSCSGESGCNRLVAGHTFEIKNHPRKELNKAYVLLEVSQHGSQPQVLGEEGLGQPSSYSCSFRCIPADVPYRPPRVTPRPLAQGAQTALVVGPSSEEVHTDEYGRIKVQFHWDRDRKLNDKSSCYIRVAQAWAGSGWGAMFIPRINQEVIVEFLDGDPDQPIVTGCVYNSDNMPPYKPIAEKTKSTIKSNSSKGGGGFNELRFEDKKGAEQIYVHGQKDIDVVIKNERRESIGADQHLTVAKSRAESVGDSDHLTVAKQKVQEVGGDYHLKVKGGHNEDTGAAHGLKVGTDLVLDAGKTITGVAGQEIYLKGGMKVVIEAGMNMTIKGPGGFVSIDPSGVTIQGIMVKINSGGSAGSGSAKSAKAPNSPMTPKKATDKP